MALFTEHLVRAHGFTGFKYTTTLQTGVAYSTLQTRQQWGELARPSQATAVELPANLGGLGSTHPQSQSRQHVQPENTDSCSKSVTARQVVQAIFICRGLQGPLNGIIALPSTHAVYKLFILFRYGSHFFKIFSSMIYTLSA